MVKVRLQRRFEKAKYQTDEEQVEQQRVEGNVPEQPVMLQAGLADIVVVVLQ